ncbi:hypothetical protein ACF0H5_020257 [Mactra antiquata]
MSTDIDIQAYRMLTTEIEKLTELPTPPDDLTDMDKFKDDINKAFQDAANTVVKVKDYADEVMKKLQEIRQALKDYNSVIGKAIKDALEKLRANAAANKSPLAAGRYKVNCHTSFASFIAGSTTTPSFGKGLVSLGNKLQRRERSFKSAPKNKSLEALEKAHALEKIANALANNRLDELTKETEKYIAKVQGGAQLTESDINDLNGNCKAFLNKTKESFEEQQRIQEEEKQRKEKEEAERLIREEQERMRKEKEEKEQKEKEEREKLEAELRRRNDPNYWPYFVYEVENKDTGKNGVCIFTCTDADFKKDDIKCTVRDSQPWKKILEPGETLTSKLFRLLPKNGQISVEVDARAYINHIALLDSETEACVKLSVNDGPWKTFTPLNITNNIVIKDSSLKFSGVKLNNFHDARMLVIVRAKSSHVNMDQEGGIIRSRVDKNIKLHVPSNAFEENTNVSLMTGHASSDRVATINSALKDSKVTSANHVITVNMDRPSNSNLQVDLPTAVNGSDSEDDVIHRVVEVSLPKRFTHDDALTVVDTVYDHVNRTAVILLFYQLESDPRRARLQCVEHTSLRNAVKMMTDDGYTYVKHLAMFLATELSTKKKIGWREFVKAVTGDLTFNSLNRRAVDVPGDIDKCAYILNEWMKDSIELLKGDSIPPVEQLIGIIIGKLADFNLSNTEKRCQSFMQVMREQLSDDSLMDLVSVWNGNVSKAGEHLGFSKKRIEEYTKGIKEPRQQLFALLRKWRASDAALKAGSGAINMLKNILGQ